MNEVSHLVSICIANYNGMVVIDDSLGSVLAGRTDNPNFKTVCAVVVAYYPDDGFEARIERVLPQVAQLVIVDNTPEGFALPEEFIKKWAETLYLITNHANKGVAFALNQGLKFAADAGYQWLLTLDQDTQCLPDMVPTLLAVASDCPFIPLVIGSNYFDSQALRTKVPEGGRTNFIEQKTVITSGSLVDVARAMAIGGFRSDYFIDQVDHEFCLRARAHGYRVIITCKSVMAHSVGQIGGVRLPFIGVLPNHPPVRKYYIARNTVVTLANYWRSEPMWCAKRLVRLFLGLVGMATLEQDRGKKIVAFAQGVFDGLQRRMGTCTRGRYV